MNIKMSVCKNQCITNSMMSHSFEDYAGICQLTKNLKIFYHMRFCCPCFSAMVSFRYVLVFLNFFVFVLWVTNIIYWNLMLNFHCQITTFSVNTIFVIDDKHTLKFRYWSKSISWKNFMFHEMPLKLSWNALKEKFHNVSFP